MQIKLLVLAILETTSLWASKLVLANLKIKLPIKYPLINPLYMYQKELALNNETIKGWYIVRLNNLRINLNLAF